MVSTTPTNNSNSMFEHPSMVLFMLGIANFFNYLDRSVFNVLAVSIKEDLALTDTQIGVVSGVSFALFYAAFSIPLARLADRGNRVRLISMCMGVWSLATAACGAAQNMAHLVVARVSVGIGEAGCVPAAYALIGDYFPPVKRAFAVGMFHAAGNFGLLVGIVAAGLLSSAIGWRLSFLLICIPGLLFAFLFAVLVKEPARGRLDGPVNNTAFAAPSFREVLNTLKKRRAFIHLIAGYSFLILALNAALTWMPHVFARYHGMSSSEIGLLYGLSAGGGTIVGAAVGGKLASPLIEKDRRWELWFPAVTVLITAPLLAIAILASDTTLALVMTFLGCVLFTANIGPGLGAIQSLSEAPIRATAAAIVLLVSAVIGQGMGPTLVGVTSDIFTPIIGDNALRWSLLLSQLFVVLAAFHFWRGGHRLVYEAVS